MSHRERYLGLDLGARRIGVAISDELGIVATPLRYVPAGAGDHGQLAALVREHKITGLVVGIPRTMSGGEGPQAKEVRAAAGDLARVLDLPLAFWDERLTTVIAERSLISGGRSRQQRREEIDSVAAAVMLQGYLDRRAAQLRTAGAGDSAILAEVLHPDDRDGE